MNRTLLKPHSLYKPTEIQVSIKRNFTEDIKRGGDNNLEKWSKTIETIVRENGDRYEGEVVFGVPHGKGSYIWPDKKYEGEWKGGAPWGKGILELIKNGERYEGEFKGGKLIRGKIVYSNGVILEGRFKNNGLEFGRRTNIDGSVDEGDFIGHSFVRTDKGGARFNMSLSDPPKKFVEDMTKADIEIWAKRLASGFEFLFITSNVDGKNLINLSGDQLEFFNEIAAIYGLGNVLVEKQQQGIKEKEVLEKFRQELKEILGDLTQKNEKEEAPKE